jgi:putative PIN family toxin of toxin-antitoxin system
VPVVLDTNIVLDLFVFADEATEALRKALTLGQLHWHATASMREELARVLAYPQIARRLEFHGRRAEAVLAAFDQGARLQPVPAKAAWTCKDPDDQKFIDLAAALPACILLSKDQAVLCMRRRLAGAGVSVLSRWPAIAAG